MHSSGMFEYYKLNDLGTSYGRPRPPSPQQWLTRNPTVRSRKLKHNTVLYSKYISKNTTGIRP